MKSFALLCLHTIVFINSHGAVQLQPEICSNYDSINEINLLTISKRVIPALEGKRKGEFGKICVIGGSTEYTGAPYFSAISALKVGADLVYVITTNSAAPVIKSYSPDLIVYPFLDLGISKIDSLLTKMDTIIIGPGLGREEGTVTLINDIIRTCKDLNKPLVVDADGLYAISKNVTVIKKYPSSGVILTPNHKEALRLKQALSTDVEWMKYWGENVAVLIKDEEDKFYSSNVTVQWQLSEGGSGRRAGGQGDILAGSLGTFYNWALKSNYCGIENNVQLAQSVSAYAAAKLTRKCSSKAYALYGRSMLASDMITEIHSAFENLFESNSSLMFII